MHVAAVEGAYAHSFAKDFKAYRDLHDELTKTNQIIAECKL